MRRKSPSSHTTRGKRTCLCCALGCPPKSVDELNLRHFHCSREQRLSMITGTSITAGIAPAAPLSTCITGASTTNCGTCTVFWHLNHTATVVAQQRAVNDNVQLQRLQLSDLDRLLKNLLDLHKKTSNTLSMDCNWGISVVCCTGPRETASAPRQWCRRPGHAQQRACQ